MPTNHSIQIVSGDPATKQLTLNPAHPVAVEVGDQITWSIASGSNVTRFRIKKKDFWPPPGVIFSRPPSDDEDVRHNATIRRFPTPWRIDYDYSVFWREDTGGGPPYEHDPKITIMPSLDFFAKKNIGLAIAVVGLVSVALLLATRKKKCF